MLTVIMKFPFFGVPETYLAHAKDASDFRGRLFELEERWEAYTRQLTREYSDFILVVRSYYLFLNSVAYSSYDQSTVLLSWVLFSCILNLRIPTTRTRVAQQWGS